MVQEEIIGVKQSIAALWQHLESIQEPVLLLCADRRQLHRLYTELRAQQCGCDEVLLFPDCETLPYDTVSTPHSLSVERMRVLYQAYSGRYRLLLSTVANASQRLPPYHWLLANSFLVEQGERRSLAAFPDLLSDSGYRRVPLVHEEYEYAVRGGVLDVFIPQHNLPIRLDFFDDEIERLRYFDPQTQLGQTSTLSSVQLLPTYEYPQSKKAREYFCRAWQQHFGGFARGVLYESIASAGIGPGAEYYLPLFFEHTNTLFDYLPESILLLETADSEKLSMHFWELLHKRIKERPENADYPMLPPEDMFINTKELQGYCSKIRSLEYALQLPRSGALLPKRNIIPEAPSKVSRMRKKYLSVPIGDLNELHPGDFIVHEDYGVGRYQGLKNIEIEGDVADYIALEYADQDELYLPIHALPLIYRHSTSDIVEPTLHSLKSKRWHRQRQKAYKQIEDMAAKLINTQAQRRLSETVLQAQIPDEYEQFSKSFPFPLTTDQQKAIDDVLGDLCHSAAMDRLVCGDVGFGKTEVAARACFVAAFNGWQSIVLVPTTLLAEQHAHAFAERFEDFPIRIATLTRNTTGLELKTLLSRLIGGEIDVLIGTHRILQEDVCFAKLGLAVMDEEHRFGVTQKERFMRLRISANALSLTATPIPRTLNMSLNALRDLSLIATPPANRLPIQTAVCPWGEAVIQEAIQRELLRDGQVYYVHNDTSTLDSCVHALQKLVPEAVVGFAHGRMSKRDVSKAMSRFYTHKINVLACTTIVESGLDVPRANTIIIERADLLGLAQLHQLRGRVGRADRQAYAWLLTPENHRIMSTDVKRRMAAIIASNELGAGFMLATQDMEIRGVGSLLGKEQSGHVEDLGAAFYLRTLERTVKRLREHPRNQDIVDKQAHHAELSLGLSTLLPDDWIIDVSVRLALYRRIAEAGTQSELNDLQIELRDRFGRIPKMALDLLTCSALQLRAARLHIQKINIQSRKGYIIFDKALTIGPDMLANLIADKALGADFAVSGAQRLNFTTLSQSPAERLEFTACILKTLSRRQESTAPDSVSNTQQVNEITGLDSVAPKTHAQ